SLGPMAWEARDRNFIKRDNRFSRCRDRFPAAIAMAPMAIAIGVMRRVATPIWPGHVIRTRHDRITRNGIKGRRPNDVSQGGRISVAVISRRRTVSLGWRNVGLGRRPFILSLRVRHVGALRCMKPDRRQRKGACGQPQLHERSHFACSSMPHSMTRWYESALA